MHLTWFIIHDGPKFMIFLSMSTEVLRKTELNTSLCKVQQEAVNCLGC